MPDAAAARREDLARIRGALELAADVIARFSPGTVAVREKDNGSPVTDADLAADEALRRALPAGDEGWLSEETPDDPARLARRRVWVVDPLDGTREFLAGLREWCVSIALVEDRVAVAGGIYAPALGELYLGAPGVGATLEGEPLAISRSETLAGTTGSDSGSRRPVVYAFWGATEDLWIGPLWPRGRARNRRAAKVPRARAGR